MGILNSQLRRLRTHLGVRQYIADLFWDGRKAEFVGFEK